MDRHISEEHPNVVPYRHFRELKEEKELKKKKELERRERIRKSRQEAGKIIERFGERFIYLLEQNG